MKISASLKLLFIVFLLGLPLLYAWSEYQRFLNTPIQTSVDEETIFTIQPGDNLSRISQRLFQEGLSPTPSIYLDLYGRYQGTANQIKAGEYAISSGTTLPALLQQFVDGKVVQYGLTIVEGMTAQQLLLKVRQHPKIVTTEELADLPAVAAALNLPDDHAEGWFLPETYKFPAGTTDIQFLRRAYLNMQSELDSAWSERSDDLPYDSPYEALIMASIIEKETGVPEERDEISGVFVRRLEKGMRLQTDPTVIYGMGESYDGNIRRKDLRTDTLYNTYTRHGLPPTPICLPSKEAIHAALHPKDGEYLFFVATGEEGRHKFSKTYSEHNKAVRKYQLNR
ncbi:endolytic transglycosylase MltG [Methylophaga sp. OBS3]|uniref:endolytic transglycosylase MltG n=1 Tax=Methylophaga sp. OBS3 TaxID=2991934 RepID=UPI002259A96E|nr:endolytic transglycosylase MltG [Methylophaga sp. OBS3]MCX4189256.1 endolytic transglycosylase MltG [Methylophaga sp. OBS3]